MDLKEAQEIINAGYTLSCGHTNNDIKDDYYFEKKLGSGGYGAVYLAKHKKTGKEGGAGQTSNLISLPGDYILPVS